MGLKAVAFVGGEATDITVGTTTITGGTNTRVLFDDNGVIGESAGLTYVKASGLLSSTQHAIGSALLTGPSTNVLGIGGSTSSFPAIKRSTVSIAFRLADDSADTSISASAIVLSGAGLLFSGTGGLNTPSDGVFKFNDNAGTSFGRLQLGGTTSSFPAIKRNSAAINFRLADDSADAAITCAGLVASGVASLTNASVSMTNLPAADPHVVGRLYTTAGAVFVSAG